MSVSHEVLARVAHELRGPLGTILGWAHMLRRHSGDEEFLHGLGVVEQSVAVQRRLIDNLLDLSSMLSGRLRLELRPVGLAAIVDAAVESIRAEAEGRSIRIEKSLDPQLPPVPADNRRVHQVLMNLLANAVRFTSDNGAIEVAIRQAQGNAEIRVRDNGRGWNEGGAPLALSAAEMSEAAAAEGGGLGLVVSRRLVEMHRGSIAGESAGEGLGATFIVRLPLD